MANFKTENWHYFPEKITVGYSKYKKPVNFCTPETDVGNFAFVTCKYKNATWVSAARFKAICGYSPTNMKDSVKQFEKMVTAAVFEFDNTPTEGFRLISYDDSEKIRNIETHGVIISDPRGFTIFMKYVDFFEILKNNGIAPNGVISGKYAYGWDCDMHMKLIHAESDKYNAGFEKSKLFYEKNNSGFIVKKPC